MKETQQEYFDSIGIVGTGLEEIKEHYTENSENGVIHHKIVTTIFSDGKQVSKSNHRQVLDETQGDYSDKLAIVSAGVMGTLAIQQAKLIKDKDLAKDALGELNNTLVLRLEEEKELRRVAELELSNLKKFDTKKLEG